MFARAQTGRLADAEPPVLRSVSGIDGSETKRSTYLGLLGALQPHALPQVHSLLSFIGQFLPLFLQPAGLSAANDTVHIAATKTENRIFG
jgi:hypothetical protein